LIFDEIKSIKSDKKELRKFGITVGTVMLGIGIFALIKGNDVYMILLPIAGLCLLLGLVAPIVLKPLQKVWMTLAILMGWLMTRVILTVTFYVIFTPIGLISRAFGKDYLNTKRKKDAGESYWVPKTQEAEIARYENQF